MHISVCVLQCVLATVGPSAYMCVFFFLQPFQVWLYLCVCVQLCMLFLFGLMCVHVHVCMCVCEQSNQYTGEELPLWLYTEAVS